MGCLLNARLGHAPARGSAVGAGMRNSIGATTMNKVCGSGLTTAIMAARAVQLGETKVIVMGGKESMSRALPARESPDMPHHEGRAGRRRPGELSPASGGGEFGYLC